MLRKRFNFYGLEVTKDASPRTIAFLERKGVEFWVKGEYVGLSKFPRCTKTEIETFLAEKSPFIQSPAMQYGFEFYQQSSPSINTSLYANHGSSKGTIIEREEFLEKNKACHCTIS